MLLSFLIAAQDPFKGSKKDNGVDTFNQSWSEGSITLNDGTELKGLIRYDDSNGILSYENDNQSQILSSKSAMAFEFFDEKLSSQRVFYSLKLKNEKGITQPFFFERIREYKDFAILSKAEPLEIKDGNSDATHYTTIKVSQAWIIYLMKPDGGLDPYIKQTNKEVSTLYSSDYKTQKNKQKNKLLANEDLLAEYIGTEKYQQLKEYAEDNKLRFTKRSDFLKIIEYYDHIRTE